jgi:hypothetical protein
MRALLAALISNLIAASMAHGAEPRQRPATVWNDDAYSQAVFFAVLEGLYRDGVSSEVVDLALAGDAATGQSDHFVHACPLCTLAREAFRLYRRRPYFESLKMPKNTFGPGIPAHVVERLRSPEKQQRLDALQGLIETWVARRIDSLRLTAEERREWEAAMEARRKEGMEILAMLNAGTSWKNCAVCDASTRACRREGAEHLLTRWA